MMYAFVAALSACLAILCTVGFGADADQPEYIADALVERIIHAGQGFGKLGLNTAVVPSHRPGRKLRINDIEYERGLGMHAKGVVVIDLGGEFETFEAEVGLQWQTGKTAGSAVFQVFVDDDKRFDSGIMKENTPAKEVRVSVKDADELRLVVTDAGDGIVSDVANWANARLTRDPKAEGRRARAAVNVAAFARVVTSDPTRIEGTQAGRVEEFPAGDISLTRELLPATDGSFTVPVEEDGTGCLGMEWREFRYFRQAGLTFADPLAVPEGVEMQYWTGQSSWQGAWKTLEAPVNKTDIGWTWRIPYKDSTRPTDKIRWIFPKTDRPIVVKGLSAQTTSVYKTADLRLEAEDQTQGSPLRIQVYNGNFLDPADESASVHRVWDPSEPLKVKVRYARTHQCKTDQTVLRFENTSPPLAVGVEDVLANEAVYVPVAGLFVTRDPAPVSLDEYRNKISDRKTLRQRVKEMPEQTFERAVRVVHKPIQNNGPMMVSLACDQRKFIAHRHGPIAFKAMYEPSAKFDGTTKRSGRGYPWPYELHAKYGDGNYEKIERHLDGEWLPLPVTTVDEDGIVYRTRTFVAPLDDEPIEGAPDWLRRRAVCVVEYTIENTRSDDAEALLTLSVLDDVKKQTPHAGQESGSRNDRRERTARSWPSSTPAGAGAAGSPHRRPTAPSLSALCRPGPRASCVGYIPAWKMSAEEHAMFRGKASQFGRRRRRSIGKILWLPQFKLISPADC